MTDQNLPPPQNLALIKGITVALGLLLVGGVALLGVLLATRGDGGPGVATDATYTLAPGETVTAAAATAHGILLTIRSDDGQRFVVVGADGTPVRTLTVRPAP